MQGTLWKSKFSSSRIRNESKIWIFIMFLAFGFCVSFIVHNICASSLHRIGKKYFLSYKLVNPMFQSRVKVKSRLVESVRHEKIIYFSPTLVKTCSFDKIEGGDQATSKYCIPIGPRSLCSMGCPAKKTLHNIPDGVIMLNSWFCTQGEWMREQDLIQRLPDCVGRFNGTFYGKYFKC